MSLAIDYHKLRLDGLYQQDAEGHLMLRIKLPAGVLSSTQAEALCDIAERFTNGMLHLTCRGSIEVHWLQYQQLPEVFRCLAAVGLSSRGACGGAVRGISCSTTFSPDFGITQTVARRINRHFAGNPCFEGLPKKFKVGVDADYESSRHLIQDVGLVYVGPGKDQSLFDVWCAGGLGRAPQAGFLLEKAVEESRLIPLIAAIVQVYRDNTLPPKRLKALVNQVGEEVLRRMIQEELARQPQPGLLQTVDGPLTAAGGDMLDVPIFAGELTSSGMRSLAAVARQHAEGFLVVTADQNIGLRLVRGASSAAVQLALKEQGFFSNPDAAVAFRICPGSHECRMGLAATREIAGLAIAAMQPSARTLTWAVSGCPNSCSQPQLADIGVLCSQQTKEDDGCRTPRFDLYRRNDTATFGVRVKENLTMNELQKFIHGLH